MNFTLCDNLGELGVISGRNLWNLINICGIEITNLVGTMILWALFKIASIHWDWSSCSGGFHGALTHDLCGKYCSQKHHEILIFFISIAIILILIITYFEIFWYIWLYLGSNGSRKTSIKSMIYRSWQLKTAGTYLHILWLLIQDK